MKLKSSATLLLLSFSVLQGGEQNTELQLLTELEAKTLVEAQMLAQEAREVARREAIISVPAVEEWDADNGEKKVRMRKIAAPEIQPVVTPAIKSVPTNAS
jgi:hypothetical protein